MAFADSTKARNSETVGVKLGAPGATAPLVVLTAEERLLELVLPVCAAAGAEPVVHPDPGAARADWGTATAVLVGVDQAEPLAAAVLPQRIGVFVVGEQADAEQVVGCSGPLGAAVALLPAGSRRLVSALVEAKAARHGLTVSVVPGSGGAGASTFAAALAYAAAWSGRRSLLVDLDPWSGGVDLLLGLEQSPGWRWPRLAAAEGNLGDLTGHLPSVDGVDVLAPARGREFVDLDTGAVRAVLRSARRTHDLVVVDSGRGLDAGRREALLQSAVTLLVADLTLRGLAAAARVRDALSTSCTDLRLVARTGSHKAIDAATAADRLGLPLLTRVPDDAAAAAAAERGEPPARSPRSRLGRCCEAVLAAILPTWTAA